MESKQLIKDIGIQTTEMKLATSKEEAVKFSEGIGYPVVLKVASFDITHKSDAGGVKVGLKNGAEVSMAYEEIMVSALKYNPKASVQGVTVQNMVKPGVEVIIGMTQDAQFGPVIMFGLGGVFVEILKDVSFKVVPLNRLDAHNMIKEIKGYRLLQGYRGQKPVDIDYLENILIKLSDFVDKNPSIKEIDFLIQCQNEYIVKYKGHFLYKNRPCIVTYFYEVLFCLIMKLKFLIYEVLIFFGYSDDGFYWLLFF